MNKLEQLYQEKKQTASFARGYLDYLGEILAQLDVNVIEVFVDILLEAREREAKIFFIGNGGSAATASHFVNDITIGTQSWHKPFRALSLTDNVATLTALGNDYGYDDIFVQQLRVFMLPEDVVVAISVSGNSPNIIKAVEYANIGGAITVGLTGFDGGRLKQIAQVGVHVSTNKGEYGPVEDVHLILDHLVSAFLMNVCRSEEDAKL